MPVATSPHAPRDGLSDRICAHDLNVPETRPLPAVNTICELDVVTDRTGFDALEVEWNGLFERAGRGTQMFQTFNWLWHWCNHYLGPAEDGHGPRISIVTARRGGRLVMVWPLAGERTGGVRKLMWMGEPVSQYGDVLIEDGEHAIPILRAAWHFVSTQLGADLVQLRKVRADAAVAPLLAEIGATVTERLGAPSLNLASAATFADYEQRYSSGSRRNRKRQRRRLEERGPVALQAPSGGHAARQLAGVAIHLKRAWLEERGLFSSAFADARVDNFFGDVAEARVRPAGCTVLALTSNGIPAALEISLRCKDRTAIHVIVYDQDFEKVAAGALLMEDSIRRSCAAGLSTFDLLAPADSYKVDWADGVIEVCDWAAPLSLAGRFYSRIYLELLRGSGKKVLAALPASVRRFAARGFSAGLSVVQSPR